MTIFGDVFNRIKGGWKTLSPNPTTGVFDAADWVETSIGPVQAMKLSAYFACLRLLSEVSGSMSFHMYDNKNRLLEDHNLYGLLRYTPNPAQSGDLFMASMQANRIVYGNSMSHIKRYRDGTPFMLDFYETDKWDVAHDEQGRPTFALNGEKVPNKDVLHWCGFSVSGYWGIPSLVAGADALWMQVASNRSAAQTFGNGLRAGGFFKMPENKQAFTDEQLAKFGSELKKFSEPQNTGKWLPLLPGMEPVVNSSYRIDPVSAELLQSRYFGIEEICRFMGVPPPLIGHTDKASSWASSIENLNQFLVDYTLVPSISRFERQIALKLLTPRERNQMYPKYNVDSLLRGNIEKRFATYKIGKDIGLYSNADLREKENMPPSDEPDGRNENE